MDNNLQDNTLNNNRPDTNSGQTLCGNCYEFFGNPLYNNLCSVCYRSLHKAAEISSAQTSNSLPDHEQGQFQVKNILQELHSINENTLVKHNDVPKQTDTKKCQKCSKKVGMLGFRCKCGFTFCKAHRVPEDHDCSFDFANVEKEKLRQANPVVIGSKIQKL